MNPRTRRSRRAKRLGRTSDTVIKRNEFWERWNAARIPAEKKDVLVWARHFYHQFYQLNVIRKLLAKAYGFSEFTQ